MVGGLSPRPHEVGLRVFDRRVEARRDPVAALAAQRQDASRSAVPPRLRASIEHYFGGTVVRPEVVASPPTTRATVSARTSSAPALFSTRAHASSVAPVVLTSSTSTTTAPVTRIPCRVREKASFTLRCRCDAGKSV